MHSFWCIWVCCKGTKLDLHKSSSQKLMFGSQTENSGLSCPTENCGQWKWHVMFLFIHQTLWRPFVRTTNRAEFWTLIFGTPTTGEVVAFFDRSPCCWSCVLVTRYSAPMRLTSFHIKCIYLTVFVFLVSTGGSRLIPTNKIKRKTFDSGEFWIEYAE